MAVTQEKNVSLKQTNTSLNVQLDALNTQLESVKIEYQHQRDSDKLLVNKYQVDYRLAQEANAVLTSQVETMKLEAQCQRDAEHDSKADFRRSLEDLRRVEEDLRAQLSQKDPGVLHEDHKNAIRAFETRVQEQEKMITGLTRQANTLATRYKEGQLVSHFPSMYFIYLTILLAIDWTRGYIRTISDQENTSASWARIRDEG